MTSPAPIAQLARVWRWLALFCLALAAYHVWALLGAWHEWAAGIRDAYGGQHRRLLLGHVSGLALALAIPFPGVFGHLQTRRQRFAFWGLWISLMTVALGSLALNWV